MILGGHIAPERWGDLAAGRLRDAEARRMFEHAARCPACARVRDRVRSAHAAMSAIGRTPAPELGWDHVRARIYWAVSSERRAQERRGGTGRRTAPAWLGGGALALAGVAALAVAVLHERRDAHRLPSLPPTTAVASATTKGGVTPVELVRPTALTGVVTMATGDVKVNGRTSNVLAERVEAASELRTQEGRLGVQFDRGSAFSVGPESKVTVRSFDSWRVELEVDGEIAVEVSRREPNQRFLVRAGARTVEVRGTAFRVVHRGQALEVACSHGRVAVSDGAGEVEVEAGAWLAVSDSEPLLGRRPAALDSAALASLNGSLAPQLPAWTDAAHAYSTTGPLVIAVARGRAVKIDGEVVGHGAMTLRMMSGRHFIQGELVSGRWSRGDWVTIGEFGAQIEVDEAAPPTSAAAERMSQLEASLDRGRVTTCLRALTKQGITDTYVELELGVDVAGAVGFLNIVKTDLPRATAACVRDAVAAVRYPPGPAASWRHRLSF